MYRVLLKVLQVNIRLKEEVEVQICIKKNQSAFLVPHKSLLKNGNAVLEIHTQFFIIPNVADFEINVMLLCGVMKKFGGLHKISLQDWDQNTNNNIYAFLSKSPDNKASIYFDFLYMTSGMPIQVKKQLISAEEIDNKKKESLYKQFSNMNHVLSQKNQFLLKELSSLKKMYEKLMQEQEIYESQSQKHEILHKEELNKLQQQKETSEQDNLKMKDKIDRMMQVIQNSGENYLINQCQSVINSNQDSFV